MLLIGGKPLLERIITQLREAGITRITVSLHYRPEKITKYFGDGEAFGVHLSYVLEDRPLGTAGCLGLLEPPEEPTLLLNGDILTRVDLRAVMRYHCEQRGDMTIGLRRYDMAVPYGVVECDGVRVRGITEKPVVRQFVNAGMYLFEPSVYGMVPRGRRMDMNDLIQHLLQAGRSVIGFPIWEEWVDIGQPEGYAKAQHDVAQWERELPSYHEATTS